MSGDQLYRMDLQAFVKQHEETGADITIATKAMPANQVSQFGVMQVEDDWRIKRFVEKPKDPELVKSLQVGAAIRAQIKDKSAQDYCLVSMGIYAFKAKVLKECLNSDYHDFGKDIIPQALGKYDLCGYLFEGYWEDIGTIAAFFEANLMLTDNLPAFDFYDELAPIYSRPRHLAASKLNSCTVNHSIVAEGCIVTRSNLNRCIIGIRSIIRGGTQLENVYMMGADRYERLDQMPETPHLGIGKNCYIRNAIIDRNVRIGNNVRLSPEGKADGFHQGPIYVKDGILCIAKNGVIPDNTIL